MDELFRKSSMIKAEASRLGFDACGISSVTRLDDDARRLSDWLGNHYHANMAYMEEHFEKRVDPAKLLEGTISVISVILNYFPAGTQQHPDAPVVSKYAYGNDYHEVIREKLNLLLLFINSSVQLVKGKGFVDSAPMLDRAWAAKSGLGWIGKNSMLISPSKGSFYFIGSLLVDIPLFYDRPIPDFCGDCSRCIHACPTSAIVSPRIIDSRRCISYLTIENKEEYINPEFKNQFHNRVFGCDICQDVCPWNRKSLPHKVNEFKPLDGLLEMSRDQWYGMDEEQFRKKFARSAIKRAKYKGLQRNLKFIQDQPVNLHDEA
jgi:epoxyqueuosine reductase